MTYKNSGELKQLKTLRVSNVTAAYKINLDVNAFLKNNLVFKTSLALGHLQKQHIQYNCSQILRNVRVMLLNYIGISVNEMESYSNVTNATRG